MAFPIIEAFLSVVGQALGIAKPLVEESLAQRYDTQQREQVAEWLSIMSTANNESRARSMYTFIQRVCSDAGHPPGPISGTSIEVPVQHLHSLVLLATENIKQDKMLASATYAIKKG